MLIVGWLGLMACTRSNDVEQTQAEVQMVVSSTEERTHSADTPTVEMKAHHTQLYFMKKENCSSNCIIGVSRFLERKEAWTPQEVLDLLYTGPLETESTLQLMACQSTGAKILKIVDQVATVQLEGGCGGCGSQSIYDLILPTLTQFSEISAVQLLDPQGRSQIDDPTQSSRPACLEP